MRRAAVAGAIAACAAALALPASAGAHASLVAGAPEPGGVAAATPRAVSLTFDEAVDAKLATIRVEDDHGRRWDAGGVTGGGHTIRVALRPGAPHGTYAVLYRVVSDDGHTIPGGFGFAIGREVAPPPARLDVGGGALGAGGGLGTASAAARAARDGGLTVAIGALLFGVLVWPAALAEAAGADERWRRRADRVTRALRRLIGGAALLGAAASASLLLLAAAPSGVAPGTLAAVLDTRFGRFTAAAGVVLLAVGAAASATRARRRASVPEAPSLRVAQLGATGLVVAPPSRRAVAVAGAVALMLSLLVVLAGHATTRAHPVLLTASGTVHVLAASAWVGGVAALLVVLGTRDRALSRAALRRFSTVALVAVAALAATGAAQALVEVGSFGALADAAFGRAVVIKAGLLLVVLGIAAGHRLDDPAATTRTLRTEALGLVAILVATGVLAGSAPPDGAPPGPPRVALAFQQALLRGTADRYGLTFTLARPGNGLAFADFERLSVTASGPGGRRAATTLRARRGGRYRAPLRLTPGRWRLAVRLRVDTYNSYTRTTEVTVR
jgi:copper transport protein